MPSPPESVSVQAGALVFTGSEPATRAFLILDGQVDLVSEHGPEATLGPGELLGEAALFSDAPRTWTARARTPCELLVFTAAQLSERLAEADPLLRVTLGSLAKRLYGASGLQGRGKAPNWEGQAEAAFRLFAFEHEMRAALRSGQFELHYQPIVRMETGHLAGVEALARWRHPRRGLLAPADFIPVAEACGAVTDVTNWCLAQVAAVLPAFKAAAERNRAVVEPVFVSVNVSALDLAQSAFAARAVSILCDAGADPRDVKLEVTESVLMEDADRCAATLQNCLDQGFRIAIDDFGTGYSSLHTLGALPFSCLKMDRSFSQDLLRESAGRKITAAILQLGRDLGLPVIAEGVETQQQRDTLRDMGCDFGQGYLFGAPLPAPAMLSRIEGWATTALKREGTVHSVA